MTYAPTNRRTDFRPMLRLDADRPTRIRENSIFLKILSCVPLIGAVAQIIVEHRLAKKFEATSPVDKHRLIKIIDIKNDFKKCGIIRNVIVLAAVITALAPIIIFAGPLAALPGILSTTLLTAAIIFNSKMIANQIAKNNRVKDQIFELSRYSAGLVSIC